MINHNQWPFSLFRTWQNRYHARRSSYYRKLAEYNLYRHNEAVDVYARKKSNRDSPKDITMGFYIADEEADTYAKLYNMYWASHIKHEQKLNILS